jgi:hypothetical protein
MEVNQGGLGGQGCDETQGATRGLASTGSIGNDAAHIEVDAPKKCKVTAYYTDRRGAGCVRTIADAAEAEKLLRGGYGALAVRLENETGEVVGTRERQYGMDDRRTKWFWWFDKDAFRCDHCNSLARSRYPHSTPESK